MPDEAFIRPNALRRSAGSLGEYQGDISLELYQVGQAEELTLPLVAASLP